MDITSTQLDDLKPYAHNPKTHPADQIEKISKSITEYGFLVPVLVDSDNNIIAGHGRLLAARKLGLTEIPTVRVDHLTEAQIRAYRIADNKLTMDGGWDLELLGLELTALQDMNVDIDLTGFSNIEVDELIIAPTEEIPPDAFPEYGEDMETENECPKCGYKW